MKAHGLDELLDDCIPTDHARQVSPTYYIEPVMRRAPRGVRVMDLGCGAGKSVDHFRRYVPDVEWHGVDVAGSAESALRARTDAPFHTYDGVNLPFADRSFEVVYSQQVFSHVRYPEQLLRDVARVLTPGGAFIGSVSSMEPYHSRSLWSFTPFGWSTLLVAAGLKLRELRPGIDSISLIRRQYLGRPAEASAWFEKSPLNAEIDQWGTQTGRRARLVNLRKLQFCGHLVFHATKV